MWQHKSTTESKFRIWLGGISTNNITFVEFTKFSPPLYSNSGWLGNKEFTGYSRDFSRKCIQGGQIKSFKNRGGGQNLNQVEFSRAVNQVHLSTDM